MRINTNVASLVAQENAANTQFKIGSSLEKLSSGLKINKAADDASGLAIADKLRTQGTSIDQGIANGNSAVTLLQIADKSMSEQSNILDTIKAKLIQANTDTTSDDGRESIRKDISKLLEQLDNIAEQTNYNGNVLLQSAAGEEASDRMASDDLNFQIGESKNDVISNTSVQSNTAGLGSKVTYANDTAITVNGTQEVGSAGTITIKGADSAGNSSTEQVTLAGDVDTIALVKDMTITAVDDDTKIALDAKVASGLATLSSGTYTVTTGSSLVLSHDTVSAIVTTKNEENSTYTSATGDVITASGISDSALKTLLEGSGFTQGSSGGTATYTALGVQNLAIEQGQSVNVTPASTAAVQASIGTGQVVVVTTGAASGSDLRVALDDTSKFEKHGTGSDAMYIAIGAQTLNLNTGDTIKYDSFTYVQNGSGSTGTSAFNAGDVITAVNVVSGSLLDNELHNSGKFTANASGTEFTVLEDFTTFTLPVSLGEEISIQQGAPATISAATAGITISGVTLDGTAAFVVSGTKVSLTSGGTQANVAGAKDLVFTATNTSGSNGTDLDLEIKAGDIITFTDITAATAASTDTLSQLIISTGASGSFGNFDDLGGGQYRANADITLKLDLGDIVNVTRSLGSSAAAKTYSGASGTTSVGAAAPSSSTYSGATSETNINLTTDSTVSITNTNTASGDTLTISGDGTNDLNNGKLQLSELAALGEGELTKDLADSFQAVVDDAITVLNGYRGDVGSTQNQVESAVRNLMTQSTNVKAAESIIRDVDYAQESANFNKQNIISQAGTYAMSQANSAAQNVLRLLQ